MLVGLGYQAQVGKDTLAGFLVRDHGFRRAAFADRLRDMASLIDAIVGPVDGQFVTFKSAVESLGYEGAKRAVPGLREHLQRLGEAARIVLGEDVWVRPVLDGVAPGERVVITDVRYRNEADAIRAAGGVLVKVVRPGFGAANGHVSETALSDYQFDLTVHNDRDISALAGEADDLVSTIESCAHWTGA